MATIRERINQFLGRREPVKQTTRQAVPGFAVYGGYIASGETSPELIGLHRWRTASDMLANVSIVAASLRFMLNLIARPSWKFEPANESAEAQAAADFMQDIIDNLEGSNWTRVVRRSAMYRFHGFSIQEWVAVKRPDGKIGLQGIYQVPQHSVTRWDWQNGLQGVEQTDPQSGQPLYLPRGKMLYLVDDTLTDRPDGMGWFRHLVEPADRLKNLLELESIGFERDLSGIPIGRAPLQQINDMVSAGRLTQEQATTMLNGVTDFVRLKRKNSSTGMVLDSSTYPSKTETGQTPSAVQQWGLELLSGKPESMEAMGAAVNRLCFDMALIMGTEQILVGREGQGSRALSEDKSRNLYLTANSTLADMAEAVNRDIVDTIWALNGLSEDLKPKAVPEDVSFKDAETIAQTLADMANAGAILAPDDPAINDLRSLMGISEAKPMDMGMVNALQGRPDPTKPPPVDPNAPKPGEDPNAPDGNGGAKGKPKPPSKEGEAKKAEAQPMYVQRKLDNAHELIAWAKAQGLTTTTPAEEMHVTQAFSRAPIDWLTAGISWPAMTVPEGGPRMIQKLGDKGAVVLLFRSHQLEDRFAELIGKGASWDHPQYQAHVTLSYQCPEELDLATITPYAGPLHFGPELFSPVVDDWEKGIIEKVAKAFNPNQPRDPKGSPTGGQWTGGGGAAPSVMFEVAPNPDDKELTDRWNSLSDAEKAAITREIAGEVTPQVMSELGIKGELAETIGGFEGAINPSLELRLTGYGSETAAAALLGDGLSQKSMVIASAKPGPGLDPVGIAAIQVPAGERGIEGVRKIWGKAGGVDGVDGFTFRNGQIEILNFTDRSIDGFAEDIDKALGGAYRIKQSTIYSRLLESKDYASGESDGRGNSRSAFRGELRKSVSASLERRLKAVGKAIAEAIKGLKRFNPSQPRDPAGSATGGQWTDGTPGEVRHLKSKAELTDPNKGRTIEELHADAVENQKDLGRIGRKLEKDVGLDFIDPGPKKLDTAREKLVRDAYEGPHQLTDLSRATFVVNNPADADAVISALAKDNVVYDKGWVRLDGSNYFDRKLFVRFDNGGIGEIQLVPKGVAQIKSGIGHRFYELARRTSTPRAIAARANRMMAKLYGAAIAGTGFEPIAFGNQS